MRERVELAIGELGYRPRLAARVMRGQSFTLGFEIPQLGNEFFTQIMQGAADALAETGYQLIIAPGVGDLRGAPVLNALVDRQVDGLIAISPEVAPLWLERLGEEVPIVLLGRHDESHSYDTLTNDDRAGAGLAMDHLFGLGHERIAHVSVGSAPEVPERLFPHAIRREVYNSAMIARGFTPQVVFGGPLEPEAYAASMRLLQVDDPPTAIFAGNDTLAIGALRARSELGLSSAELSIVGYDDIALASQPFVSLTTVDQFGTQSGRMAVQLLMERIVQGRTESRHHSIGPELRVRTSSSRRLSR